MVEEKASKAGMSEAQVQIKTLFSRLTGMFMDSIKTRRDGADAIVIISTWASLTLATILVMIEDKNKPGESILTAEHIGKTMGQEIKKHVVMIRGIAKSRQDKNIILPGEGGS